MMLSNSTRCYKKPSLAGLKSQFNLSKKVPLNQSPNVLIARKADYSFIDIFYLSLLLIQALLFVYNIFFLELENQTIVYQLLLFIPFCLFVVFVKEIIRLLVFKMIGAENISLKFWKNYSFLFGFTASVVTSKSQQLIISLLPFLSIHLLLIFLYSSAVLSPLLLSASMLLQTVYAAKEFEIIDICLLKWRKSFYSYFDTENKLLLFFE
jgi:hypothetical protein